MQKDDIAYGCIHCATGREDRIASELMQACPRITACAMKQKKRRTRNGKTEWIEAVLFPGYVFFSAPSGENIHAFLPQDYFLSLLTSEAGNWQFGSEDVTFAKWVFANQGLIGLSSACLVGNRVHMLAGPLKEYEASIVSIDKRNRNGKVHLSVGGRTFQAWFAYELTDLDG